jgi:hypothetical protein
MGGCPQSAVFQSIEHDRDSCIAEETHPGPYSQLLFPLALQRAGSASGKSIKYPAHAHDIGKLCRVLPEDFTLCKAKFPTKFFGFNSLLDVVSSKT